MKPPAIRAAAARHRAAPRAAVAALLLLSGCALTPLYAGGGSGVAAATLGSIAVDPIPDRAGYLLRSALQDRFGGDPGNPRYRLEVAIDDAITGFGIRGDDSISRERRTLRARYRLVSVDTGAVVFEATTGSDAGIDVVGSEYAVVAAEDTATERLATEVADQISTRIALFARQTASARD